MLETYTYPPIQAQAQTKHSHTALWLAIGAIAAVAIFSIIVVLGVWVGLNQIKETGPTPARFYLALQSQNYALAYTYLDAGAKISNQDFSQQSFIAQAAQTDSRSTAISGFEFNDKGSPDAATVKVSRGGSSYEVHLTLKQVDGRWLITSLDRL